MASIDSSDDEARSTIDRGWAKINEDPELGLYWIRSGNIEMAYLHADSPSKCFEHLLAVVNAIVMGYEEYSIAPSLERQNDSLLFALAAGRVDLARRVGSIPVKHQDSHAFDRKLNQLLRTLIGVEGAEAQVNYRGTSSEQALFTTLEQLAKPREPKTSLDGLGEYWRATKSRRYAYSIHQKLDLFSMAGRTIVG